MELRKGLRATMSFFALLGITWVSKLLPLHHHHAYHNNPTTTTPSLLFFDHTMDLWVYPPVRLRLWMWLLCLSMYQYIRGFYVL